MLSVGATFAADNASDVIAIDDEISIDEPLAIEQDVQEVSANESSETVYITNSNIDQYISTSGQIYENVTADELVFNDTFDNLNLTVDRSITLTGGVFNNPNFEIYSSNIVLQNFTIVQNKGMNSIFVAGLENNHTENVTISNVNIEFIDDQNGAGSVPIEVMNTENFVLADSEIVYTGKTNGSYISNAIRVTNSRNAMIFNNKIFASVVSAYVPWPEEPAGSDNWIRSPVSGAIVVKDSKELIFDSNIVNVTYSDVSGSSDTIYVVDIDGVDDAIITNNDIVANGNTYIYGIILTGDDFIIRANNITATGNYYANGIDLEGPSFGVVEDNVIDVKAPTSAYAIYSGMNGQNVSANYTGNNITGSAYNIFGFSLGDVESNVVENYINLEGNYTTGLAARTGVLNVTGNRFVLMSSEEGNETIWEGFGVLARGIFAMTGNVTIDNNVIATSGTGVYLTGVDDAVVENNFINVVANTDKNAYAIYAGVLGGLTVVDNNIDYEGATQGTGINNALFITGTDNAIVANNNFTIDLVSSYIPWAEEPAGSGNWTSSPVSEGIVVKWSNSTIFDGNKVNVTYNNVVGAYDTIYAIDFIESDNAVIANNDIVANGNSYIYGIILTGDDFIIRANNISSTGTYYANGIDLEGPASGVVEDNVIDVQSPTTAYAIYSGMNGQNVSANYTGNNITGKSYNLFGFSLGDVESNVVKNYINLEGNYTTGLAARTGVLNVTENRFVLMSSEQGNESIWEGFDVAARGIFAITGNVTIDNNVIATPGTGVFLNGVDDAVVENNFINVVANTDKDAFAIYADDLGGLTVADNNIDYEGATQGTGINNALFISETDDAIVANNNFTIDLVSSYIPWAEEPAGSGNWVSSPVSEGIVVKYSNGTIFDGNKVNVTYNDVVGAYDTIYSVDFVESDNAIITNNHIVANGYTYIYGIILSGDDFIIRANTIGSTGDYYANGIDIEGPASGVVEDNVIDVAATTSAYAIYSGMNGQDVKANYTGNRITGVAYNTFGFSLGDVESNIDANVIMLGGNYTTGIAYRGDAITVTNNTIYAMGSNEGNESVWEAFGVETIGIKVVQGNSTITNNDIVASGDYPIDVKDTVALVHDNHLVGERFIGDEGVNNDANSNVYNNTPEIGNKTATIVEITEVTGNIDVSGVVSYGNGTPIANDEVSYTINGVKGTVKTDANGTFTISDLENGKLDILYGGDSFIAPVNASITLKDIAPQRLGSEFNVTNGMKFTAYAVDYNAGERGMPFVVQLKDSEGKVIANATVQFGINGFVHNKTTDENGIAELPINLVSANTYTVAVSYLGDNLHNATFAVASLVVDKKPITITAKAATYKQATKTKKYTATIKTIKGSSADGKTYLKAGKKVTLKINGKTYSAKTNAKGQVTFKITKLTKKGKYTALIKFAGDKTYAAKSLKVKITVK